VTAEIKDSGERRTFDSGAQRDRGNTYKGRPDLMPIYPLLRAAVHFEKGAIKYQPRNWELGMPLSEYYNSAMRHAWKVLAGFDDEDHEAAWLWNVMCFIETKERIARGLLPADLDDMPRTYAGQEPGF